MCICFTTSPSPRVHMPSAEHNGVVGQDVNRGRQHCDGIYSIKQTKQSKTKKPKSAPPRGLFRSPLAPTRIHRRNKKLCISDFRGHSKYTLSNDNALQLDRLLFPTETMVPHVISFRFTPTFQSILFFVLLGHQTNYNTTQDPNRCKSSKMQQGAFTNVRI